MPTSKRPRACDNCHSIKIKCELGSTGGPGPCERCSRLGKECIITPPKRQKDRVAELEAQVQALTKLLEAQKLKTAADAARKSPEVVVINGVDDQTNHQPLPQKKRKLSFDLLEEATLQYDPKAADNIEADAFVPRDVQQRLLDKYLNEMVPAFPLCPITDNIEYGEMRKLRPLLLQAIVYAASSGVLSTDVQEEMGNIIMSLFATEAIADGTKSLELVQAMQIVVMWYRAPRNHTHISAFQMVEIMTSMAEKLACGGPCGRPLGSPNGRQAVIAKDLSANDTRRAWNVCQLFSEAMAIFIRRPCPHQWDDNLANGLFMVEYAYALPTDRLLCQYVRAEALCGKIATQSKYYTWAVQEVSDPESQQKMQALQNLITDWKVQIPPDLWCMGLEFWEHAMTMYLHEPVLHTNTNKASFSAPFLAEKLSVTDFPKPIVSQEHLTSIVALKTASHAIIDLYTSLDIQTVMIMPAVQFSARVLYALYILVKIHVASTAIGNTLGAFIDTETLQIDACMDKLTGSAKMVGEIDDRCGQYRILQAVTRMREWISNFNSWSVDRINKPVMDQNSINSSPLQPQPTVTEDIDWNNYIADDAIGGFGLDELFPELSPNEILTEPIGGLSYYSAF